MRHLFLSYTLILGSLLFAQTASSQESVRERIAKRQQTQSKNQSLPQLSIRANNQNKTQTQNIEEVPWMREIYRTLDLNKDKNASLYYPVTPIDDRMNLFTMMFKLMVNGEITAYEYLVNGREIFTEEYAVKVKDLLDRFSIMYTEEGGRFIVDESDIPSNEVLRYYIKEAWYFDKTNSMVDTKILAICPVILRQDDFGVETTPYPLFWLPYEEIRPYAARMPIMTSSLNNATTQTIDDYFRKRSYDGEIYKTTNPRNITLAQAFTGDSLKKEQAKIEAQLVEFKKELWAVNDSIPAPADTKKGKKKKDDGKFKTETRTNEKLEEKKEESKQKASSSSTKQAKAQPTRSIRGRR